VHAHRFSSPSSAFASNDDIKPHRTYNIYSKKGLTAKTEGQEHIISDPGRY